MLTTRFAVPTLGQYVKQMYLTAKVKCSPLIVPENLTHHLLFSATVIFSVYLDVQKHWDVVILEYSGAEDLFCL